MLEVDLSGWAVAGLHSREDDGDDVAGTEVMQEGIVTTRWEFVEATEVGLWFNEE